MGNKGYFMKETPQLMNMVNIQYTVIVPLGINKVFEFFINNNVSKYYPLMSKGHKYFTLREGERMEIGSIIDCYAKGQYPRTRLREGASGRYTGHGP